MDACPGPVRYAVPDCGVIWTSMYFESNRLSVLLICQYDMDSVLMECKDDFVG